MKLRKSDRECDAAIPHYAIKRGFEGRSLFENLTDAVSNRVNVTKAQHIDQLIPSGINPYKKAEMHNKYHVLSLKFTGMMSAMKHQLRRNRKLSKRRNRRNLQ